MNEPVLGGMAQTTLDRPDPLLRMGNTNCGGCGLSSLMQMMRHATADQRVHLVVPACCAAVSAGVYPQSTYGAPTLLTTFASAAAAASGIASVAAMNGEDTRVICIAGDGGTYDIGFATLSAAAECIDLLCPAGTIVSGVYKNNETKVLYTSKGDHKTDRSN